MNITKESKQNKKEEFSDEEIQGCFFATQFAAFCVCLIIAGFRWFVGISDEFSVPLHLGRFLIEGYFFPAFLRFYSIGFFLALIVCIIWLIWIWLQSFQSFYWYNKLENILLKASRIFGLFCAIMFLILMCFFIFLICYAIIIS